MLLLVGPKSNHGRGRAVLLVALQPTHTFRVIIPALLALTLGFQIVLSSFFLSVLGLSRHRSRIR